MNFRQKKEGKHCLSLFRTKWLVQCRHDFAIDRMFMPEKFPNNGRINAHCIMNANNHAAATLGKVRDNNGHNTKDNIDNFHDEVSLGCSIICTVVRTQANKTTVSTFAYWLVLSNCEILLRLAAGNKTCLHVASDFINSSIVRARNGLHLDFINFSTMVSSTNAVTITASHWISEEQDNCQGAITAGVSSDATTFWQTLKQLLVHIAGSQVPKEGSARWHDLYPHSAWVKCGGNATTLTVVAAIVTELDATTTCHHFYWSCQKLLEKDRPEEIELQDQLPNSSQNLHSQLLHSI